ncbi:MAG: T9SS type A sorting domain-containing protein [Salinibacter sp.]|uniref:T9SS type A sorting domain-containing protein n=1 Tax=Salinibacter sp. TaxID=2065818 RepID=UPI0035D51522
MGEGQAEEEQSAPEGLGNETPGGSANLVMRAAAGLTGVRFGSSTSIADVNGDGNLDLLITGDSDSGRTATVYLGDGQGGFTEAGAGLTGVGFGSSTSIADVNGDQNKDLLITGADTNLDPTATLYLGDGQGGFSEAGAGLTRVLQGSTSIADVDGDGNQDLLITGRDANDNPTATLYLGDGQGGFSEANAGLTRVLQGSTSIADVDGDGNEDLLITGGDTSGNRTATLYLGDGQGGFSEAGAGLTRVLQGSTSIADVDGDGFQDLLIAGNDGNDRTATLYLGDGQGGFAEANAGLTGVWPSSTSIADVDGDQDKDLLITGFSDSGPTATLYLGDGQGGFSEAGAGLTGVIESSTSIADVDGDQDKDLLITGFSRASQSVSAILYENLFDNPLPVELASFGAAVTEADKIRLTWQTASETGNARFEIQRRADKQGPWSRVGSVEGAGTTTEAQSYRFTDEGPPYEADRLAYRLKQVDTDGSASYSKEVTVERSVKEVELLGTYPNPAQQRATVRYAVPERQDVKMYLYDILGRRVQTVVDGEREGRHKRQLNVSRLASGVYFLRLRAESATKTQRLTVVR